MSGTLAISDECHCQSIGVQKCADGWVAVTGRLLVSAVRLADGWSVQFLFSPDQLSYGHAVTGCPVRLSLLPLSLGDGDTMISQSLSQVLDSLLVSVTVVWICWTMEVS